jgi:methionyl-tRNA synthetase
MDPLALARTFSVDGYRYYFLRDVQFGADGSISLERMLQVYNADLANSWGNLCSRVLNMTAKYLGSTTPSLWEKTTTRLTEEMGNPLAALVSGAAGHRVSEQDAGQEVLEQEATRKDLQARYAAAFAAQDYSGALAVAMELVDAANLYVENSAPWALAKAAAIEAADAAEKGEDLTQAATPTQADRLAFVLYNLLESLRIAALLFAPVMPNSSAEVWRRLGLGSIAEIDDQAAACVWGGLPAGLTTTVGAPLFMRLTEDDIDLA